MSKSDCQDVNGCQWKKKARQREPNFTHKEEKLLVMCVKKYLQVVENKTTDAFSNQEKNKIWERISNDFNKSCDRFRSLKALKEKYENLKKRAKKLFAEEKTFNKGTGGGPYKDFGITDVDLLVKEILGKRLEGCQSHFDGDCSDNEETAELPSNPYVLEDDELKEKRDEEENNVITEEYIQKGDENRIDQTCDTSLTMPGLEKSRQLDNDTLEMEESIISTEPSPSFKKLNIKSLRTPTSRVLLQEKREPVIEKNKNTKSFGPKRPRPSDPLKSKLGQWAHSKVELVELQKKHLQEEHDKKMQHLDTKHSLELEHMQREHEARIQKFFKLNN